MRRSGFDGGWFLCLLINMIINFEWSIPAWVFLALHFILGLSIWFFIGGLAFWVLCIASGMWLMGVACRLGNQPDPKKENKNPYSVKQTRDNNEKIF